MINLNTYLNNERTKCLTVKLNGLMRKKGYGFIKPNDEDKDIFVHVFQLLKRLE